MANQLAKMGSETPGPETAWGISKRTAKKFPGTRRIEIP
jgi:hypothetical protein